VDVNGNTSTVVCYAYSAVFQNCDFNVVTVPGECFIDRVVDYFVDKVVEAAFTGGTDVHAGTLTDCFKAFKNRNRTCIVVAVVWDYGVERL
jgi:hypothetical protein